MKISEYSLRELIREVLLESLAYIPPDKEMIDGVINDHFVDSNSNSLSKVDSQAVRNRYESGGEFLSRIAGPDLLNEIKELKKIFSVVTVEQLIKTRLEDFKVESSVMNRLRFLKSLSEEELKKVVKGLDFLFPDYVKLGYEKYSSEEERVRKVKAKNIIIKDKKIILDDLPNKILNRLAGAGKYDYEDTSNMTKYAVLTLQKLSERPADQEAS